MAHHPAGSAGGDGDLDGTGGSTVAGVALAQLIARKVGKGYRVESQSATEARLVAQGRRRWLGLGGGRVAERREILRVDAHGCTSVEVLPARRY